MTFFPDLSPYTYCPNEPLDPVNVGWLEAWEPMPTGETSAYFRQTLKQLCKERVCETRGNHWCSFCNRIFGSAEIRVRGVNRAYAGPDLIHHYVEVHEYKPPEEFITAVLAYARASSREPPRK